MQMQFTPSLFVNASKLQVADDAHDNRIGWGKLWPVLPTAWTGGLLLVPLVNAFFAE